MRKFQCLLFKLKCYYIIYMTVTLSKLLTDLQFLLARLRSQYFFKFSFCLMALYFNSTLKSHVKLHKILQNSFSITFFSLKLLSIKPLK